MRQDRRRNWIFQRDHGNQVIIQVKSPRTAHYSSLSRSSPGTSSCGTSCVRTSPSSEPSASSTPFTTSASNAFPCSSNSSTLSESAPWTLDNPCKSPDCSPARTPSLSNGNDTVSTLWLLPRTCSLSAPAVFTCAFFGAAFVFANFFLGVTLLLNSFLLIAFFIGATSFPRLLCEFVCFFLAFSLVAIRAVYHPGQTRRSRGRVAGTKVVRSGVQQARGGAHEISLSCDSFPDFVFCFWN